MRARKEQTMATKEQTARDRVGNACAALFDVESMLPHDSPDRQMVYRMRLRLREIREQVIRAATAGTENGA
jgi:hypothetical protein